MNIWKPHKYQEKAIDFLTERQSGALFLEPGLGKTSITLAVIDQLLKHRVVKRVLILAPLRCCEGVWLSEIDKWRNFSHLRAVFLYGKYKQELLGHNTEIVVTNYETLKWLALDNRYKSFDLLIVDELSKLKSTKSGRFEIVRKMQPNFKAIYGLTGSPVANGLMGLFGQCFILDGGKTFGKYITHYRETYFYQEPYQQFTWSLKQGAEEKIYEKLETLALTMKAVDYLEMPEIIENNVVVELPDNAKVFYNALKNDFVAKVSEGSVTALNAVVSIGKLHQVANGAIYKDAENEELVKNTSREVIEIHSEKIDALADLIDELQGNPLLVAYNFKHDLDRLQKAFGGDVPYIGSGVSPEQTTTIIKDWNLGKIPVLFGHPMSMSHGLNLQACGYHICFFSLTYNQEIYDQFIRRVYRQGNKSKNVFVHHIIAKDTVDEVLLSVVKQKTKNQNSLFEALKKL